MRVRSRGPVQPPPQAGNAVGFDRFTLDLDTGELHSGGKPVALRPQATRALIHMVRNRGRLVTRQELRRELWGDTAVVWSAGIHQAIRQIRSALGDEERRLLETVPRRGYRFTAVVRTAAPLESATSRRPRLRAVGYYAAGLATPVLLLILALLTCVLLQ